MSSNVSLTAVATNYVQHTATVISLPPDQLTVEALDSARCKVVNNATTGRTTYQVVGSKATVDALIVTAQTATIATPYGEATGSGTYTATLAPAPTSLASGLTVKVKFGTTNSGAATLNVNGLGAVAIKKGVSTALVASDIIASAVYELTHDGTNWVIAGVQLSDYGAAVTASANTYTLALSPAATVLITGQPYYVKFADTNAGTTPTLNINGLGAKTLVKSASTALSISDLVVGKIYTVIYDGTNYQINI